MSMRTEIYVTLTNIFRELFDDENINLTPATTAADIDGWDSFNNLNIIAAAEQAFGVKINSREIESLGSVGDLTALIERKISSR